MLSELRNIVRGIDFGTERTLQKNACNGKKHNGIENEFEIEKTTRRINPGVMKCARHWKHRMIFR